MKPFINDNFLLASGIAQSLFHQVAKSLPIIDFHNHINPSPLASNKRFDNLAQLWVNEDPYKHRAMRICGIAEDGITGSSSDKDKYLNWMVTVPKTAGNPLFHWSCLELKRIFGIDAIPTLKNSEEIWEHCNKKLAEPGFGALDILQKFNTEIICTSDDLTDDLRAHKMILENDSKLKVLPSLRGDAIIAFDGDSPAWILKLSGVSNPITSLSEYQDTIIQALNSFSHTGCLLADHSLDAGFDFILPTATIASELFTRFLSKGDLTRKEVVLLKSSLLLFLGQEYSKRGWTLQLHIGAQRATSSRLRKLAGAAGGYATIGKSCDIEALCSFFDALEQSGHLPRIILYTLNPSDNAAFATLTGSYSEDGTRGKIQFGPAWWYNDHYDGIREHLVTLSAYGLLSQFVGMTTDSRSLLSFSRHEYFRRVLCNFIGTKVEVGELPEDEELLHSLIKDTCYYNSKALIFNQ